MCFRLCRRLRVQKRKLKRVNSVSPPKADRDGYVRFVPPPVMDRSQTVKPRRARLPATARNGPSSSPSLLHRNNFSGRYWCACFPSAACFLVP